MKHRRDKWRYSGMKRLISLALIPIFLLLLLAGCGSNVSAIRINLNDYNFSVRDDSTPQLGEPSPESTETLALYLDAISKAMENTPADAYTFDFSSAGFVSKEDARNYLIPALRDKYGENRIIEKSELEAVGIWAVPSDGGFKTDVKEIWIGAYNNADGNTEFVIDIRRNDFVLKTLRYVNVNGALTEKEDKLSLNYDGREPADNPPLTAEVSDTSKTLYFGGRLHKTGIFEVPVLDSIEFLLKIEGKPVAGSGLPGGFAGGFEGTVTIDGMTFPLTLDGAGFEIPVGMVADPSMYYIAFSEVGINNPQDRTTYRNVYFIKTDLSQAVGLYSLSKYDTFCNWFETARVSSDTFTQKVEENNKKLTSLYTDIILKTYGDRKEYNNTLAVLYNMFIGVDRNYLVKNLKNGISTVSKDIRNYADAIKDEKIARKGENGLYFFPDGRSMVVRLFSYDGTRAIAAIDFSSKQDSGYGALYEAVYSNGSWVLTTLLDKRIK